MKKSLLTSLFACLIFATSTQIESYSVGGPTFVKQQMMGLAITAAQSVGWMYLAGRALTKPETITKKEVALTNIPFLIFVAGNIPDIADEIAYEIGYYSRSLKRKYSNWRNPNAQPETPAVNQ